jgi:hypothetical protein
MPRGSSVSFNSAGICTFTPRKAQIFHEVRSGARRERKTKGRKIPAQLIMPNKYHAYARISNKKM